MITIPNNNNIRLTTDFDAPQNTQVVPCVAKVAMTNPGPVSVDSGGANAAGQAQVNPATSASAAAYIGYNIQRSRALGQACTAIHKGIVDGFAGVTPGSPVYIDTTSADASSTASGLTHTQPSANDAASQSVELLAGNNSATVSVNIVVPAGVSSLSGLDLTTTAAAAASDTNYWTATLTNKGVGGAGTTVMLDTGTENTTKATGGNGGFAANVLNPFTLTSTTANLAVTPGQVLQLTLTVTGSAPALNGLVVRATFASTLNVGQPAIGLGLTSTKIFFH